MHTYKTFYYQVCQEKVVLNIFGYKMMSLMGIFSTLHNYRPTYKKTNTFFITPIHFHYVLKQYSRIHFSFHYIFYINKNENIRIINYNNIASRIK